ncbi:MAG: M23 family metallopeptidase [Bacteroidia bacterium]
MMLLLLWGAVACPAFVSFRPILYMPYLSPLKNALVVSGFGMRLHPVLQESRMHQGVDFRAKEGTPVYAAGSGLVLEAGESSGNYGIMIDIHHDNTYVTRYAHLSKVEVKAGEVVVAGQLIGYSGNTGLTTGPHLHYEVIQDKNKVDPMIYLPEEVKVEEAGVSVD